MKHISRFALLIVLAVLLYLLISGNLLAPSPFVIAPQLAALALSIWARLSFRSNQFSVHAEPRIGGLLAKGPYEYIRHPMYASALLLVWSGILSHLTLINLIIGALAIAVIAIRISVEEAYLRRRFPDYKKYAGKTRRLIPFII